jgi:hypothetical protein
MQSPLGRNHALPASTGGSPDWEYDHTRRGQLSDAEIAVTQGAHYLFFYSNLRV